MPRNPARRRTLISSRTVFTHLGEAVEGLGLSLTWFRQTSVDEVWSAIWLKHRTEFRTLHH